MVKISVQLKKLSALSLKGLSVPCYNAPCTFCPKSEISCTDVADCLLVGGPHNIRAQGGRRS